MNHRWLLVTLLVLLARLGHAATLPDTAWGRIEALATGRLVPGPAGWLNFCLGEPDRCRPASRAVELHPTSQLLALLQRVQVDINRRIVPEPEPAGRDLWRIATTGGDCEDYALAKQARLLAAGLPAGAVRLATAHLPDGELHAVVTVATDRGTLVLDNLQPDVVPLHMLDYAWLRVQGVQGDLRWDELRALAAEAAPGASHAVPAATADRARQGSRQSE